MTNTDKLLTTATAHEFKRCKDAFLSYVIKQTELICNMSNQKQKIECYNSYVDFVSHLYEFYLACIKRDKRYPNNPTWEQTDKIMHIEATRLISIRLERILRGDAPQWENRIASYQIEIPNEFGKHFRTVRNLRSHVDSRRVNYDLADFFKKYHRFLYIMYEELIWLWDTDATEAPKQDWGEIERFAIAITERPS